MTSNTKKTMLFIGEALLWTAVACTWYGSLKYAASGGLSGLGGELWLWVLMPFIALGVCFRLGTAHLTGKTFFIAGIIDNAYLCTVSALTFWYVWREYFFLHILTMLVLNMLLRIKVLETDCGAHADMKKVIMWAVIAMIQTAWLVLIFTKAV